MGRGGGGGCGPDIGKILLMEPKYTYKPQSRKVQRLTVIQLSSNDLNTFGILKVQFELMSVNQSARSGGIILFFFFPFSLTSRRFY